MRKTAPKLEPPFKVYVYESLGKKISCRKCAIGQDCLARSPFGCNEGAGAVVGEFVCYEKECFAVGSLRCDKIEELACLSYQEMIEYFYKPEELDGKTVKAGTALHITEPKRYDTPKELWEFYKHDNAYDNMFGWVFEDRKKKVPIKRPPQSYMYVEEIEE